MVRELGGARARWRCSAAASSVVNPVTWFDSVVWGQVDSVGVVFLLLGLRELWRDRPERAAILTVVAAIIKPQLGILVPLVAVVTIRRALWPVRRTTAAPTTRPAARRRPRPRAAWERATGARSGSSRPALAGFLTAVVLCLPFGLSVSSSRPGAVPRVRPDRPDRRAGGGYPYLSVNAYNPWALVPERRGNSLAQQPGCGSATSAGRRPPSQLRRRASPSFGRVPAVVSGRVLLVADRSRLDPVASSPGGRTG